jgi:uncharacterized damage-inducible protein DinB
MEKEKSNTMQPYFSDYLNNLDELHLDILESISDLPQEALDWIPFPGGNSLSVLVVHLIGAQRYWFSDIVAGVPSGRDRDSEFKVKNLTSEELKSHLQESWTYAAKVLESLDLVDLAVKRSTFRFDHQVSLAWGLEHALKHTAIHLGHIQITRQLWDMQ